MALIRPPGHHAMVKECNGFCIFNNAALLAKNLLNNASSSGIHKILIVDIYVHHGQGTQRAFIDDPRVLYFSIHRYEHGKYWPHLKESNFNEIGSGKGRGYTLNVPLNEIQLGDAEYISILHRVLLPLAYEYNPDLVLVSGGYDACMGCPEGEMRVSPAFYGHLIQSLSAISLGRLLVLLEGGYFIDSLAEGVAMTVRSLLGDPCVPLSLPSWRVAPSLVESLLSVFSYARSSWKQLDWMETYENNKAEENDFRPDVKYLYEEKAEVVTPEGFTLGEDYYILGPDKLKHYTEILDKEKAVYEPHWSKKKGSVAYVFDKEMMKHSNLDDPSHPECPQRIQTALDMHAEFGILSHMEEIPTKRRISSEEILMVHGADHIKDLNKLLSLKNSQVDLENFGDEFESIFFNAHSHDGAHFAAGAFLDLVDSVLSPKKSVESGIAFIRPPGHHAEPDEFMGFSILNNVALGAAYAKKKYGLQRVLIFDWDVHHGNGIQKAFYEDPSVLYISAHRFDEGSFFPCKDDADAHFTGQGSGKGFNVNIPWNGPGVGDPEYMAAFMQVVMPIAYEFQPQLVLVAAGFDAAVNDPLGHCKVSPQMYGHMTHHLSRLAGGRVILALEGGYNLTSISLGMVMCSRALLGMSLPMPNLEQEPRARDLATIRSVLQVQGEHWASLSPFSTRIPSSLLHPNNEPDEEVAQSLNNLSINEKSRKKELEYVPSEYGFHCSSPFVNTMSSSPSTMKSSTTSSSVSKNK
eukprot:TRINITY_DN1635_c0_g1_i1.p1 TRINITY_DN1635_c0_g1~~TRINITY_DN1635_c0_g1_i1.p1  ORF type:complete len:800 (-),score=218.63 TRINITY_DN1635_c0_g1_i1:1071-3314(-)